MPLRLTFLAATAVAAATALPAAAAPFVGVSNGTSLVAFDSATPGTITNSLAITGLGAGETILGIDTRPATGALYGLGSSRNLYAISLQNGSASLVPGGPLATSGGSFGFAFNPVPDRLRLVSDLDQSLRINVANSVTIVDGSINSSTIADPVVPAVAYTNQVAGTVGATQLFGIETSTDSLVLINPPNNGTLATIGALGVDFGLDASFDIVSAGIGSNTAFAAGGGRFYSVNLGTGAATLIGGIGAGGVTSVAAAAVPEPASMSVLGLGLVGLLAARRRRVG